MRIAIISAHEAWLYRPSNSPLKLYSAHGNVRELILWWLLPRSDMGVAQYNAATIQSTEDTSIVDGETIRAMHD